jgi:hypothetical protein
MPIRAKSKASPQAKLIGHTSQTSLPNHVRILGKDFSIAYFPQQDEYDAAGQMDEGTLSISVQPDQPLIEEIDVVLHETIHAIDYVMDLDLTERQVRLLGTAMAGIFQDNPEFASFVTRQLPRKTE